MDQAKVHKSQITREKIKKEKADIQFIPPKITADVQPLDKGVFHLIKLRYLQMAQNFLIKHEMKKQLTTTKMIKWIAGIWRDFQKEEVVKAFRSSNITL
jgi:hypothetical protein